ncbi:MAG: TIGR03087 family PEP-CTERM/XrtA system glycosyltransferase [Pseudomonadota bacterium]|nr:TIGR03087 family PEP-CTERM/XrtA system glycosyltransferase [Pseudomonadota bacterium]
MANLLYLVHRLPYPPNKGDKVRSYHLLKHLVARHRVFVGTFVDDPEDEAHVDTLRALCAELHVTRLHPARARIASLVGLMGGEALTLRYYRDAALQHWVRDTVRSERIDAAVIFSSSMAQYADGTGLPMLVDFVDVDSAKWTEYAAHHRWPMSWLYQREGRELLAYERTLASRATRSFFVTEKETELFRSMAPESAGNCEAMCNGVDADYFAPDPQRESPFANDELPLVFSGAMDYWPNIDAVTWFASEILPRLRARWPTLRLHIAGRNPTPTVRALAGPAINVTGTVPDMRPYLQHAAVVVAPLRLARGIQNKILEAMAMGRPVVAARECADAITAQRGSELICAEDADGFVREVDALLREPARAASMGEAGRRRVQRDYSWEAHLSAFDRHLTPLCTDQPLAA